MKGKLNVVLLGSPGAGKGTYAKRLKEIYGLPHISTGDLFRKEVANNTKIGELAKQYLDAGELVPKEQVFELVDKRLSEEDANKGAFFDGFPRTVEQARIFEEKDGVDVVLNFKVDKEVIIRRLSGRRTCSDCGTVFHVEKLPPKVEGVCDNCGGELIRRKDEEPETIKQRLKIYEEQTFPLAEYYKKLDKLYNIDANLDISNPNSHIIEDCIKILDKVKNE